MIIAAVVALGLGLRAYRTRHVTDPGGMTPAQLAEFAAHPPVIDPEQLYPGRTIPELLSVTPDTLVLSGSRAFDVVRLHITYKIVHPDKVDRAVLQLWNDAVGVIDTTLLPVQERGEFDWAVQGPINVGPLVRLRAHCPNGETNSFVWGTPRQPSDAPMTITGTNPQYVREAIPDDPNPANVTAPVEVYFNGIDVRCQLIANINGDDVALTTNRGRTGGLLGFVKRDIMPGPVLTRWFELKLLLRASDGGMEAVRRVPFVDR
jgi:hypothetical protein